MFIKHEEGKTELVYEVKVNIPPVGLVYDYKEKDWIKVPVFKLENNKDQQKWFRHVPGFDYDEERELEKQKQRYDKLYFDPKVLLSLELFEISNLLSLYLKLETLFVLDANS